MMNRCLLLRSDTNSRDEKEINQSDETVRPASAVKDVVAESAHVCCLELPISCGGGAGAGILDLPPTAFIPDASFSIELPQTS